jgi:hypothetical protein
MSFLPSIFKLHADVIAVMASYFANGIRNGEMHCFKCKRNVARNNPIDPELIIGPRIAARATGRTGDRNIGLQVDRIGCGLPPLHSDGRHEL